MPLAFLVLGTGVVFIWSALSGKGAWDAITSVLKGESLDTSLSTSGAPPVVPTSGNAADTASGTGTATPSAGPSTTGLDASGHSVDDLKAYAKALLAQYNWSGQWEDFNTLVNKESGWRWNARNPGQLGYLDETHAYGIPQALPPGKMISAGPDWKTNGYTQLRWMMAYIKGRYGSPSAALAWHRSHNWY